MLTCSGNRFMGSVTGLVGNRFKRSFMSWSEFYIYKIRLKKFN